MKVVDALKDRLLVALEPTDSLRYAKELMALHTIRHLPVLTEGRVRGVLSMGDLFVAETVMGLDDESTAVETVMTPEPITATPDEDLAALLARMNAEHVGTVIVVDAHARPIGIFTATDACKVLADILNSQRPQKTV